MLNFGKKTPTSKSAGKPTTSGPESNTGQTPGTSQPQPSEPSNPASSTPNTSDSKSVPTVKKLNNIQQPANGSTAAAVDLNSGQQQATVGASSTTPTSPSSSNTTLLSSSKNSSPKTTANNSLAETPTKRSKVEITLKADQKEQQQQQQSASAKSDLRLAAGNESGAIGTSPAVQASAPVESTTDLDASGAKKKKKTKKKKKKSATSSGADAEPGALSKSVTSPALAVISTTPITCESSKASSGAAVTKPAALAKTPASPAKTAEFISVLTDASVKSASPVATHTEVKSSGKSFEKTSTTVHTQIQTQTQTQTQRQKVVKEDVKTQSKVATAAQVTQVKTQLNPPEVSNKVTKSPEPERKSGIEPGLKKSVTAAAISPSANAKPSGSTPTKQTPVATPEPEPRPSSRESTGATGGELRRSQTQKVDASFWDPTPGSNAIEKRRHLQRAATLKESFVEHVKIWKSVDKGGESEEEEEQTVTEVTESVAQVAERAKAERYKELQEIKDKIARIKQEKFKGKESASVKDQIGSSSVASSSSNPNKPQRSATIATLGMALTSDTVVKPENGEFSSSTALNNNNNNHHSSSSQNGDARSEDDGCSEDYQLDLKNLRHRFESGASNEDSEAGVTSVADKNVLARSDSILVRLQKYQAAIAGRKANGFGRDSDSSSASSSSESDSEGETIDGQVNGSGRSSANKRDPNSVPVIKSRKKREKIAKFAEMSKLKSQWESGNVRPTVDDEEEEEPRPQDTSKEDLIKLRQRLCLGRSESMRQVFERAAKEGASSLNPVQRSSTQLLDVTIKTGSIKQKFESGNLNNETAEETLERLRREKLEDLSVLSKEEDIMAKEARNIFKKIDTKCSKLQSKDSSSYHRNSIDKLSNGNGNGHTNNMIKRPTPNVRSAYMFGACDASQVNGEVIKSSDPINDDVVIETEKLQERFKFFENYREPAKEARKFEMTPPREINGSHKNGTNGTNAEDESENEIPRDPNVVRSSDKIEDLPKTDVAKKMLSKFKELESQIDKKTTNGSLGPKPLKRITPPRDYNPNAENGAQNRDDETPERDPNIVRSSYKTEEEIPIEPEKARSLKEKFERLNQEMDRLEKLEREKNGHLGLPEDEADFVPQVDTTKNLRMKWEAISEMNNNRSNNLPLEKPTRSRVNRFI